MAIESTAPSAPDTASTQACEQKDFVAWRRGRSHYAVWVIALDLPILRAASARMRDHLAAYLLPGYDRQPHITLRICGFPGPANGFDDDYPPALFKAQIESLESARLQPFAIEIGGPETFADAPYFAVGDDAGAIARARQALGSEGPGEKDFTYIPHVTFGLYGGRFGLAEVLQRMRTCPALTTTRVSVDKLVLMTYEAALIGGPLTAVCEFDLARQALRILDAGALGVGATAGGVRTLV